MTASTWRRRDFDDGRPKTWSSIVDESDQLKVVE